MRHMHSGNHCRFAVCTGRRGAKWEVAQVSWALNEGGHAGLGRESLVHLCLGWIPSKINAVMNTGSVVKALSEC